MMLRAAASMALIFASAQARRERHAGDEGTSHVVRR
jgi:hypothetical protein